MRLGESLSRDERVQAFCLLLVPAFVAHALQLLGEDTPWAPHAWSRYWFEPGWHLYLPPWVPAALAVALALAVLGLAVFRTRPWVVALAAIYVLHYLTYPYRIRNHMTLTLAGMLVIGGLFLIDRRPARADRHVATGLAAVLCITYFFAGFHKINANFLTVGPSSSAVPGIDDFFVYGDLGGEAPWLARALAVYGTVVIECLVPLIAWRVPRLTIPAILVLFAFHFPMVSVMNVSDYPMIASAFYPALFTRARFRLVLRRAGPTRWTIGGALLGVAAQAWFVPYWGALTIFGVFVMALWGWAAGAMVALGYAGVVTGRHTRASPSSRVTVSQRLDG